MRRALARVLLATFAAGQLQLIPATIACAREHSRPAMASHCVGAPQAAGPIVHAAPTPWAGVCPFLGPCAVQPPAVAGVTVTVAALVAASGPARPAAALLPDSFDSAPPAPPPEA